MSLSKTHGWAAALTIGLTAILAIGAIAQDALPVSTPEGPITDPSLPVGAGWTSVTDPTGVIAARYALMLQMEQMMLPLDAYTAGEAYDLKELRANAAGIARLLKIVPYLFPPTTNLYDESTNTPLTIALPILWENFDVFESLAQETQKLAYEASRITDPEVLKQTAYDIRDACETCHESFLIPYQPQSVTAEDLNYDFGVFS